MSQECRWFHQDAATQVPLGQLAALAGYREQSALSRSCQRVVRVVAIRLPPPRAKGRLRQPIVGQGCRRFHQDAAATKKGASMVVTSSISQIIEFSFLRELPIVVTIFGSEWFEPSG